MTDWLHPAICPKCGSDDIRCATPGIVYQKAKFDIDTDTIEYGPIAVEDVELAGNDWYLCVNCAETSTEEEVRASTKTRAKNV